MKLRCSMKFILGVVLFSGVFFLGIMANSIRVGWDRRPKQLQGKQFIDIGEVESHNKALLDFYIKYKTGVGFAAIRQAHSGFEGTVFMYLMTENGKFTGFLEEKGVFSNSYREIDSKAIKIGFENSEGHFIEIDPVNYEAIDLRLVGRE